MESVVVAHDQFFNWSLTQISKEFGIARETVGRRLNEAGVKASGMRRNFPVYRVREVAEAILVPQNSLGGLMNDPDQMVPKERSDWFKSENDRIKFQKETALLVSVDECRDQMAEIVKISLRVLETLPDKLERDFDFQPEVIDEVEMMVDALRVDMAEQLEA